jgi:hypothetical protein
VWNSQRKKFFEKNRFSAILGPLFCPKEKLVCGCAFASSRRVGLKKVSNTLEQAIIRVKDFDRILQAVML